MAFLADDLLDQALAEPQSAQSWHRLFQCLAATPVPAQWQPVLERVAGIALDDPRAESLRLTFLRDVTGDARYAAQAAAAVLSIEPPNADRLAAFMAYPWLCALTTEADRASFVAALVGARLPEMAARLARCASALLPARLAPRVPQAIEHIAVIAPSLGDCHHPAGVMVASQCEILARAGCRVHVFSAEELQVPDISLFRGSTARVQLPPPDTQHWLNALPAGTNLSISDSRFSLKQRWRDMFPAIAQFDPDAILLVGLYSPLAAALYAVRPVVGLSPHTLPPLAPLDVWLSADEPNALPPATAWSSAFAAPLKHSHPYRIKGPQGPWSVTRAELGLAEDAVVWLTVGARLESEVGGAWAARMLELLARHPEVVWLLVGGAGNLPPALTNAAAGRVRSLAARSDIGGILALSNIYVNPPRMGGGFSVAEAMAQGLPVLSFAGSDGGDKVGELAVTAMDTYLERLAALTTNPGLRAETGRTLRARFDQRYDLAASGPSLMAAFEQAAAAARERLSSSVS